MNYFALKHWSGRRAIIAACLGVFLSVIAVASGSTNSITTNELSPQAADFKQPKTLAELLALRPEQLQKVDIAVMNLLCAEGLPGSENLDVPQLVNTLDSWAQWIAMITKQNSHRFVEDPKYFNNSQGDYRMAMLATTVQLDFGVRYNPERAEPQLKDGPYAEPEKVFFANSKDIFIHGLLADKHYGTCASMPVLFVALAKRLGYPVNLAVSTSHFLVRYEEGGHHFDVEATSPGFSVYPDEHYKSWPVPTSDEEIAKQHYFQPLTSTETLAEFLSARAVCLKAAGQLEKARDASAIARKLAPQLPRLSQTLDAYNAELADSRTKAKSDQLTTDISNLGLPEGDKFKYFRERKIGLNFYLMQTGDLDGAEKALVELKSDLAAESLKDGARINLTTNATARSNANTVIVLHRAKYVTPNGQEIELTEQSPGQMDSLLREQRILDKAVAVMQGNRWASGLPPVPWEAIRFNNVQPPPNLSREAGLKQMEDRLDDLLKDQQAAADLRNQTGQGNATNTPVTASLSNEAQTTLDLINRVNALNGQNRGVTTSPFSSSFPQLNGALAGAGLPPQLQNLMNLVGHESGTGNGTVPTPNPFSPQTTVVPAQAGLPPEAQGALDQVNKAYELKRQFDLLQQPSAVNSVPSGKAQK